MTNALPLDAFRKLLEPHCEIVGAVADGLALFEAAERLRPEGRGHFHASVERLGCLRTFASDVAGGAADFSHGERSDPASRLRKK